MRTSTRVIRILKWKMWNKFFRYINWHIGKYGHTGLLYSEDEFL